MGAARYEVWLASPQGTRIAVLDQAVTISLVRTVNRVGQFEVVLPLAVFDRAWAREDLIVDLWRRGDSGTLQRQVAGFVRRVQFFHDQQERGYVSLGGVSAMYLLDSRITAYAAGEAEAAKTDYADDLMKAVVRENLGALATDTDRDLTSAGFSVAADRGAGPEITRAFAWRNVLQVLQTLEEAAAQAGTMVYYDVVPRWQGNRITFRFETYVGQRGADRSRSSQAPTLLGLEFGNIQSPRLEMDWTDERNVIYVGGQGTGTARTVSEVSDSTRIARSPWNRREHFAQATNESTTDGLTNRGRTELEARKPYMRFTCKLLSVPGAEYGRDWDWGDRVTANYAGRQFDGWINAVSLKAGDDGNEDIDAKIEVES